MLALGELRLHSEETGTPATTCVSGIFCHVGCHQQPTPHSLLSHYEWEVRVQDGAAVGLSESAQQRSSLRGPRPGQAGNSRGSWRRRLEGSGAVEAARVLSGPDSHISSLKTRSPRFLEVSPGACAGPERGGLGSWRTEHPAPQGGANPCPSPGGATPTTCPCSQGSREGLLGA